MPFKHLFQQQGNNWGFVSFFFLYYGASAITIVFLPLVLQDKGMTSLEIGAFLAVGPIVSLSVQPIWGFLADRLGRLRAILLFALAGSLVSAIGLFAVQEKSFLLISYVLYTLFSCPVIPLLDSWNLSYCESRGARYGRFRLCGSLGFAMTSIALGWLAVNAGLNRMVILYAFSLCLAALALLLIQAEEASMKRPGASYWMGIKELAQNRRLWGLILFLFAIGLSAKSVDTFYSLFIVENGGSSLLVGVGWALACLSEVPVLAAVNRWISKRGAGLMLVLAAFGYAIRWALPLISLHPWWLIAIQLSHGLTQALFFVAAMHLIREMTPPELRSSAQSLLVIMLYTIPGMIGGTLGGWLRDSGHTSLLFLFASILSLAAVLTWSLKNTTWLRGRVQTGKAVQTGKGLL